MKEDPQIEKRESESEDVTVADVTLSVRRCVIATCDRVARGGAVGDDARLLDTLLDHLSTNPTFGRM